MAKLYFSYAAMNAGKSTLLLQASYNYVERGTLDLTDENNIHIKACNGAACQTVDLIRTKK